MAMIAFRASRSFGRSSWDVAFVEKHSSGSPEYSSRPAVWLFFPPTIVGVVVADVLRSNLMPQRSWVLIRLLASASARCRNWALCIRARGWVR